MAAETNMRVANATTSAQYFHLLRRQAQLLTIDPLPLVVMTPKSLLRHPLAQSSLRELAEGRWQPVIDDPLTAENPDAVRRLLLCSGKVYVDLISDERRAKATETAIVRLEQLYPVRTDEIKAVMDSYPKLTELIWLQEEPANAGSWDFLRPYLFELAGSDLKLDVISRRRRASPAEGSAAAHARNQAALLTRAFDWKG
jgi:2-oxoglutarate dehydrogenase E1 component